MTSFLISLLHLPHTPLFALLMLQQQATAQISLQRLFRHLVVHEMHDGVALPELFKLSMFECVERQRQLGFILNLKSSVFCGC
jgi:hypothetical protein